jgi:hypothetical protein
LPQCVITGSFQIHRARFLQIGINYIVIFLLLGVYEVWILFTEQEIEEIKTMALFSALFYLPWMLKSKYAPR